RTLHPIHQHTRQERRGRRKITSLHYDTSMIEKLCAVYAPTRASAMSNRSSVNPSTTAARHPCPRDHGTACGVHDTCGRARRDTPARTPTRADTALAGGVPVTD